jgi:hypothetical protein
MSFTQDRSYWTAKQAWIDEMRQAADRHTSSQVVCLIWNTATKYPFAPLYAYKFEIVPSSKLTMLQTYPL